MDTKGVWMVLALAGCGGDAFGTADIVIDGGAPDAVVAVDSGADAGVDGASDAGEAGPDAALPDALPEASPDALPDAATVGVVDDAGHDGGTDAAACAPPPPAAWACLPGLSIAPGEWCNTWPWAGSLSGTSYAIPAACAACGYTCDCVVPPSPDAGADAAWTPGLCNGKGYTCKEESGRVTVSCL